MRITIIFLLLLMTTACNQTESWEGSIESLLTTQTDRFGTVMENPEKYRVQVIYTQIDRDAGNHPSFRSFKYRVNPVEYFYPASTVKLPTAALALQKLKHLDIKGLNRDTAMLTGSAADYQTEARTDDTSPTGLPSVANYIRKILLVSDNDAFNRLYEFVGQQELNEALRNKAYADTRIVHRLELALSKDENQWTNPVHFFDGDELIYKQDAVRSHVNYYGTTPELLGLAEMVDGNRLERPKDFSEKNAYGLQDQHDFIKNLMFPQSAGSERRLDLDGDDYRFLYQYMSMYPGESDIEAYRNPDRYPDGYVKFLMYGGDTEVIPPNIRVFNKVGDAYGFLTDSAYIVDFKNNIEFLLSATIYSNENQTFNDDNYEYDEVALPFLENLGLAIYELELERQRNHEPDLSLFQFPESSY